MKKYRVFMAGFEEFDRIPLPQPGVFIAHDFSGRDKSDNKSDAPRQVEDYRLAYEDGLRDAGYIPVYAPVHSGTILQTLCKEMINTDAGIFDVSFGRKYNANVLIELGISLGINHPTLVVAEEKDKPLLDFLEILNPLYYHDDNDLSDRIGKVIGERINDFHKRLSRHFCVICQKTDCRCRKGYPQEEKRYLLVGADEQTSILRDMKQVAKTFQIEPLEMTDDHNTQLCNWLYHIRKSRFVLLYSQELGKRHHGVENAKTMVQLGMAIGAGIPWRIMLKDDENVPTDVTGYIDIRIMPTHTLTRSNLEGAIGALRDINMPYLGVEDILPMGEWVEEEEEPGIDDMPTGLPLSPMINVPPMPEESVPQEAVTQLKNMLLSNPTEPITISQLKLDDIENDILVDTNMKGFSQISLATSVCYLPDVREYFDLGICWIDGSISESVLTGELYDALEEILGEFITRLEDMNGNMFISSFVGVFKFQIGRKSANSRILLIINNVQDPEIAQALSALATPQSVVLFTTRDSDILVSQEADVSQPADNGYWFISYSRKDLEFAERLVEDLENAGIRIWHDRSSMNVGVNYQPQIINALKNATGMILVMTENALISKQVMTEVNRMLELGKPIIPIAISDVPTNIPSELQQLNLLIMRDNYQASLPRLITAIRQYTINATSEDIRQSKYETSPNQRQISPQDLARASKAQSQDELTEAIEIYRMADDKEKQAEAEFNLAILYLLSDDVQTAIDFVSRAILHTQNRANQTNWNKELTWLKQQVNKTSKRDNIRAEVTALLDDLERVYIKDGGSGLRMILSEGGFSEHAIDQIVIIIQRRIMRDSKDYKSSFMS